MTSFDIVAVYLNVINFGLMSILAYISWNIGRKIGFSRPWIIISSAYIIAVLGGAIRSFGQYLPDSPDILEIGIGISVIAYILLMIGFYQIYKVVKGQK